MRDSDPLAAFPLPTRENHYPSSVGSLPDPATTLIGRESEIAAIHALLIRTEIHLLTLVGPPGIGKTCLALQIVHDIQRSTSWEVAFISLAALEDPALLFPIIAQSLGIQENERRSLFADITAYLYNRPTLLVLDTFEHLVSSAPQLNELLGTCPYLKLLVTSREFLRLLCEQVFSVPPLPLPELSPLSSAQELATCPSVALFLHRARTVKPDFFLTESNADALAQLCLRLEGIPLAIELAAAQIHVFSPRLILEHLDHYAWLLTRHISDPYRIIKRLTRHASAAMLC